MKFVKGCNNQVKKLYFNGQIELKAKLLLRSEYICIKIYLGLHSLDYKPVIQYK